MEHVWLSLFADTLLGIDRLLQKSLRRAIPGVDELQADPAHVLSRQKIAIGPLRRYAVSVVIGFAFGFLPFCALGMASLDRPNPRPGPPPLGEVILLIALLVLPVILAMGSLLYLTRGGQMWLTSEGVVLRYRKD